MNHRGQTALFLVLAVFLIVSLGMVSYLNISRSSPSAGIPETGTSTTEASTILNRAVTACLDLSMERAVSRLTRWGGHIERSDPAAEIPPVDLSTPPPTLLAILSSIQNRLSTSIEKNLSDCVKDHIPKPWTLSIGSPQVRTTINPSSTLLEASMTSTITLGDLSHTQREFSSEYRIPLYPLLESYSDILNEIHHDATTTCITCLHRFATNRAQHIQLIDIDETHTLFIISANGASTDSGPLEFWFTVKRRTP